MRLLVAKTLAPSECEVTEASNGFNAFFAIESARPHLIPARSAHARDGGFGTLRRLKVTHELFDIPVIMLASRADRPLQPELTTMGATAIVMKPFKPEGILEAVGRVLKLSRPKARRCSWTASSDR